DEAAFADLVQLVEGADIRTGFFLTDADGIVTQGARLAPGSIGEPLDRAGFDELLAALAADPQVPGGWIPMAPGITSDLPNTAFVLALRQGEANELRGTFVFESEVSVRTAFNLEFSQLGRGDPGAPVVFDAGG